MVGNPRQQSRLTQNGMSEVLYALAGAAIASVGNDEESLYRVWPKASHNEAQAGMRRHRQTHALAWLSPEVENWAGGFDMNEICATADATE